MDSLPCYDDRETYALVLEGGDDNTFLGRVVMLKNESCGSPLSLGFLGAADNNQCSLCI